MEEAGAGAGLEGEREQDRGRESEPELVLEQEVGRELPDGPRDATAVVAPGEEVATCSPGGGAASDPAAGRASGTGAAPAVVSRESGGLRSGKDASAEAAPRKSSALSALLNMLQTDAGEGSATDVASGHQVEGATEANVRGADAGAGACDRAGATGALPPATAQPAGGVVIPPVLGKQQDLLVTVLAEAHPEGPDAVLQTLEVKLEPALESTFERKPERKTEGSDDDPATKSPGAARWRDAIEAANAGGWTGWLVQQALALHVRHPPLRAVAQRLGVPLPPIPEPVREIEARTPRESLLQRLVNGLRASVMALRGLGPVLVRIWPALLLMALAIVGVLAVLQRSAAVMAGGAFLLLCVASWVARDLILRWVAWRVRVWARAGSRSRMEKTPGRAVTFRSLALWLAGGCVLATISVLAVREVVLLRLEGEGLVVRNREATLGVPRECRTAGEMAAFLRSRLEALREVDGLLRVRSLAIRLDASWGEQPCPEITAVPGEGEPSAGLAGLSDFPALETLDLEGLNVRGLADELRALPELRRLILRRTRVAEVPHLAAFPRLVVLDLTGCPVSKVEGLAGAVTLEYLDVSGTDVSSLEDLRNLDRLETLRASGTTIAEIPGLKDLQGLRRLDFHGAPLLTHVRGLGALRSIREVDLGRTALTELDDLEVLTELEVLRVDHTKVRSLAGLGTPGLTRLMVAGLRDLTSVGDLARFPRLRQLDASGTGIRELQGLDSVPELRELKLGQTAVVHLKGLEKLTRLEFLDVMDTPMLRALPPCGMLRSLRVLRAGGSGISGLPGLEQAVDLRELVLRDATRLAEMPPLAAFPRLEVLDIAGTPIATLGSPELPPVLTELQVQDTGVRKLPGLAAARRLVRLDVSGTALAPADLQQALGSLPFLREIRAERCPALAPFLRAYAQEHPQVRVVLTPEDDEAR